MERLTEKQYRRVALLFGFDGPSMSQREVAEVEEVDRRAVGDSLRQVVGRKERIATDRLVRFVASNLGQHWPEKERETLRGYAQLLKRRMGKRWVEGQKAGKVPGKLGADAYLWLYWLVGNFFTLRDTSSQEAYEATRLYSSEVEAGKKKRHALLAKNIKAAAQDFANESDEAKHSVRGDRSTTWKDTVRMLNNEDTQRGWSFIRPNPGRDSWEADRFHPKSKYDRSVDELTEKFKRGRLSRVEYETELVLALASDRVSRAFQQDKDELRQNVEWAVGARELGAITGRECDRRISSALRAYVEG